MISKSYQLEGNINLLAEQNCCLFYGENVGLKNDFKSKIKKKFTDYETLFFSQEEVLNKSEIFFRELNNKSLFGKKKIFFLEKANDKILEIIKDTVDSLIDQKIIIFSDILDRKSKLKEFIEKSTNYLAVACYPDNEITIRKIILKKLNGFKGLTTNNINLIIENSNLDRVKIYNEVEKIITYFEDKNIDTLKLEEILNIKENDDFSILKDEALNGNKFKTNKLLGDTIIRQENIIFYLAQINQRLMKLSEISTASESFGLEEAMNKTKPPIFWKDKQNVLAQIKKWNNNKIKILLNKTFNLEIKLKSNSIINKNVLIKKLIIDTCELANA